MLGDWTGLMYRRHGALHHMDVLSGATVYRVFLLASTLQVDIAFAPDFGHVLAAEAGCAELPGGPEEG